MTLIATLRDIAAVIICIEMFVMLLIPGAIVYLMVKGVTWVQKQVRKYGPIVRHGFGQANQIAEDVSHKVAAPVIVTSTTITRLQRMRAAVSVQLFQHP